VVEKETVINFESTEKLPTGNEKNFLLMTRNKSFTLNGIDWSGAIRWRLKRVLSKL